MFGMAVMVVVLVMLIMDVAKEVVLEEVVELVVAGEVELVVEAVVVVAVVVVGEEIVVDVVVIEMVNNFKVVIASVQERFRACLYKTNIMLCNGLFLFCIIILAVKWARVITAYILILS